MDKYSLAVKLGIAALAVAVAIYMGLDPSSIMNTILGSTISVPIAH